MNHNHMSLSIKRNDDYENLSKNLAENKKRVSIPKTLFVLKKKTHPVPKTSYLCQYIIIVNHVCSNIILYFPIIMLYLHIILSCNFHDTRTCLYLTRKDLRVDCKYVLSNFTMFAIIIIIIIRIIILQLASCDAYLYDM